MRMRRRVSLFVAGLLGVVGSVAVAGVAEAATAPVLALSLDDVVRPL
jgi:hypothetical protein